MPPPKKPPQPNLVSREFRSVEEIDRGIEKLRRRIEEVNNLDPAGVLHRDGTIAAAESEVRNTIREVFGPDSAAFREHQHLDLWAGPRIRGMDPQRVLESTTQGKTKVITLLEGLIGRLKERREDLFEDGGKPRPEALLGAVSLHPRIATVAEKRFRDGHHWDAVFAASKALMNLVQECSHNYDLDGKPLMERVFSVNNPILAFNDRQTDSERNEQQGMMHLFVGAVLAIRNPGAHSFPDGSPERALEYLQLLSLLAFRAEEAQLVE